MNYRLLLKCKNEDVTLANNKFLTLVNVFFALAN